MHAVLLTFSLPYFSNTCKSWSALAGKIVLCIQFLSIWCCSSKIHKAYVMHVFEDCVMNKVNN
jgi:hypothetical protein